MNEEIKKEVNEKTKEHKCDICGKIFKSESGLVGHKRLSHSQQQVKSIPSDIGERLVALESKIASTTKVVTEDSPESVMKALEVLIPLAEKYLIVIGPYGERKNKGFWNVERKWAIRQLKDYEVTAYQDGGFGHSAPKDEKK